RLGEAMSAAPPKPMSSPARRFNVMGSSWSTKAATTMAHRGVRAFRTLASADEMDWAPQLMSNAGRATLNRARTTSFLLAPAALGQRPFVARSATTRNRLAMAIRQVTSVNGGIPELSPILMNRNDE